jgi:adenosine deaminase
MRAGGRSRCVSRWVSLGGLCFLTLGASLASAQASSASARAAQAFEAARRDGPPALEVFLKQMPKGADLHMHLSGAVYAETILKDAAEDHLCVNLALLRFDRSYRAPGCPNGEMAAGEVPANAKIYQNLIDAFSMRSFVPKSAESGHDQFFETFDRFGGTDKRHNGEWIDEVAARAADQNEQYLEVMDTPDFKAAATLAEKIGFDRDFARYREKLLAAGIRDSIPAIRAGYDQADAARQAIEHCGQPDATPACQVKVRYLYQVLREMPPPVVFAQLLLGFEVASVDPRVVGINMVQPEDGYISMRDYRLHMAMIDALHHFYPQVHISLHAGELTMGLVPPEGLRFHIRAAVEEGHAERIGHGVDIAYEDNAPQLLREMAERHVMVEINLTSNAVILGVEGKNHPLMLYRQYGVPTALSTDDEGVSRIDLTHEYVRAADTYPLSYEDLKEMARTSIEHSFLPGASLWERFTPERLTTPVAACRGQLGADQPAGACAALVAHSQKAQQEWELERRFHRFEASF